MVKAYPWYFLSATFEENTGDVGGCDELFVGW